MRLIVLLLASAALVAADPTTRDPWQWPFAATSIWNMPIGTGAVYKPANFQAAAHVGVDTQHILALSASDPLRQCFLSTTFGPGRDEGTESIDFWLRLPDAWLVPDAGSSPYGGTPNSNYALRRWGAEADLVHEGSMITRTTVGGPFFLPDYMRWPNNRKDQSITGDGLQGGGQGASGMSALGGTLRRGELTGSGPIRHVLKVNPWAAKYCHYSTAVPGWKWPAESADNYASSNYSRNADPAIVMGSLFAIPPGATAESLGLTTEPGRKLFAAMQDYGVYFTDDAAWDTWDLVVERYAAEDFAQAHGFTMGSATWKAEVNKLMQALSVITNNTPSSIGGGGTPRKPLAPPFAGANAAPSVSAGPDRTITLPATASLDGTVTNDGLPVGAAVTSTWSKVSGPGTVTFGSATAVDTTASFSVAGTYVLRLTASDTVLSASDDVQVVVNGAVTTAPAITTQPSNATVTAPATATFTVTASGSPVPTYQWSSAPSGSATFTAISGATSASYTTGATSTAMSGIKYRCVATNSVGSTTSTAATLTISAWTTTDIGAVAAAGSSAISGGTWTVIGSGADIWNTSDEFRFTSQAVSGDVVVTARVTGLQNTHPWAKAGVMVRETVSATSRHAFTCLTASSGPAFQRRLTTAGSSVHTSGPTLAAPGWVRLERVGNVFISSISSNGATWTEIRRDTITMTTAVQVGLAVTSHADGTLCTATFSDVTVVSALTTVN